MGCSSSSPSSKHKSNIPTSNKDDNVVNNNGYSDDKNNDNSDKKENDIKLGNNRVRLNHKHSNSSRGASSSLNSSSRGNNKLHGRFLDAHGKITFRSQLSKQRPMNEFHIVYDEGVLLGEGMFEITFCFLSNLLC